MSYAPHELKGAIAQQISMIASIASGWGYLPGTDGPAAAAQIAAELKEAAEVVRAALPLVRAVQARVQQEVGR